MAIEITTPVGRFVQGGLYELQGKTDSFNKPVLKDGVQVMGAYLGLAIDKINPEWPAFWQQLSQVARTDQPHCFDAQGNQLFRDFAWKVIDGDSMDMYGKPWASREGFAGCYVLKFGGQYLPKVVHNGELVTIKDYVKPGMFIRVIGSAKGNGTTNPKPGLYLNPAAVELIGYGKPIVGGINAVEAFAKAAKPVYIPAGMSTTPVAGAPMPNVGLSPTAGPGGPAPLAGPGGPAMPGLQPMQPQAGFVAQTLGQQPLQPITPVQPAGMAMQGPGGPAPMAQQPMNMGGPGMAMPGLQPVQQAAPVLKPTPLAQGYTLEQWLATGRTQQDLIAAGMFAY